MEDYASYLVDESRSGGAALHEFIVRHDPNDDSLHLFFEGDDDSAFYMPFIRTYRPAPNIWNYVCGGKAFVEAVREYLNANNYSLERVMFFVDRDYDDFLDCQISSDERTFITDYYSTENYLVGAQQAEIVLVDLAGLAKSDRDCAAFLNLVDGLLDRWAELMLPFLAYAIAAKEGGGAPNFKNVKLERIFALGVQPEQCVKRRDGFAVFRRALISQTHSVSFSDVRRWVGVFRSSDRKLWLRGKFELWFFEKALSLFLEDVIAARRAAKKKAPRMPASLRDSRLFEALGGRLPPPQRLLSFLR